MPSIVIQVVATSVETKPTAKGSYQQLEVTYKNLTFQGKVESKKLMSFGAGAGAFTTLSSADSGSKWSVEYVKNEKGFNDWLSVVPSEGAVQATPPAAHAPAKSYAAGAATTKSTYETPEERAARQVLIVRQSSVSSAVALLSPGSKGALKVDDVLNTAKAIEDYVFGNNVKVDQPESGFDDMENDVPY